jgi:3-hexulose-6-phosphate synthase / 6-phospho-3-hexuloisomerase
MSDIKLQVALDFVELRRALAVAEKAVEGGADYLEAGTPLIKSEGLDAVRALRERFPDTTIIADMKTMDAGRIEAEAAAKAGANVVTVLGGATESTIRECVEAGKHYGALVAVDLLGVVDPLDFASRAAELGIAWLDVHCPIDAQMSGADPLALLKEVRQATGLTLAAAGGLNSETSAIAADAGADVIIVGGAITKAEDPRQATADIRKAIDTRQAVETELFKRVSSDTIREALEKVRTPNVSMAAHNQPSLPDLLPLIQGARCCGEAVTVRTAPGDWAKPVEAIDIAKEGDVLVVDAGGRPPAIWGELATESAMNKGIAGLVVFGAVRDTSDIRRMGLPVWATMITAHAGEPKGLGEINEAIEIGHQTIRSGDWIVADDDGVMVIPKERAVEIANRAADVLEAENRIRREIRDGNSTLSKVVDLKRWEKHREGNIIG